MNKKIIIFLSSVLCAAQLYTSTSDASGRTPAASQIVFHFNHCPPHQVTIPPHASEDIIRSILIAQAVPSLATCTGFVEGHNHTIRAYLKTLKV